MSKNNQISLEQAKNNLNQFCKGQPGCTALSGLNTNSKEYYIAVEQLAEQLAHLFNNGTDFGPVNKDLLKVSIGLILIDGTKKGYIDASVKKEVELKGVDCSPPEKKTDIRFIDLAGSKREKIELMISFINPLIFPGLFTSVSKGILLYGPPGTGKTFLMKAAINELPDTVLYAPTPGDLRGKYEGETEKKIQNVFNCAGDSIRLGDARIAVVFMDEVESIASDRSKGDRSTGRSVGALLQAIDGISSQKNVSFVAATNYPWDLDDAILRRFSSRIFVDLPDREARYGIILDKLRKQYNLKGNPVETVIYSIITKSSRAVYKDVKGDPTVFVDEIASRVCGDISKLESRNINIADIQNLVYILGPNLDAMQIMSQRQGPEEFTKFGITKYGYTASDISKIMDLAFVESSMRAISDPDVPHFVKSENGHWVYKYNTGIYLSTLSVSQVPDIRTLNDIIRLGEQAKVVTYDLTGSDICQALYKYPSTLSNENYEKLLKYAGYAR